jgi:hypothetical protein
MLDNPEQTPNAPRGQAAIEYAVEGLLASLPVPVADAIRRGAIPHRCNPQLLRDLYGDDLDTAQVLSEMLRFHLGRQDAQGYFRYHDAVRAYLLAWWRRERPQQYEAVNQVALAYFNTLAAASTSVERPIYEREALYHLLVVDETAGIEYLGVRFEDACERYQLGTAEGFVSQLAELKDIITDRGRAWMQYFEARLNLIYHRDDAGESIFEDLAGHAPDPVLQGAARWSLGQVRVNQQRWSQAISLYHTSLSALQQERSVMYSTRVMLALGDAYQDLADKSGGFREEPSTSFGAAGRFFHFLQNLPFLIYRWLARRVPFLPDWYGISYQDWIIAYLLGASRRWYQRAERQLKHSGDTQTVVAAHMCLAELAHQLGHWSSARRRYALLLETEAIKGSLYRTAQVRLGQGRALLDEGKLSEARVALFEAFETFVRFLDDRSIGDTGALLGRVYAALGQLDESVSAYVQSAQAFGNIQDKLARTQVIWALEDLAQHAALTEEQQQRIGAAVAEVDERHYITRFPDILLRRFRRLALLGALPLTYYALPVIAFLTWGGSAFIIEGLVLLSRTGTSVVAQIAIGAILIASATLSFVLLAVWLYRLIYSLIGMAAVRVLGHRLIPVERDQPSRIVVDATGLTHHDIAKGMIRIRWPEVSLLASIHYYRWQRLIHLFSSLIVAAGSRMIVPIDAITAGYDYLRQDIVRHLEHQPDSTKQLDLNFVVLDSRWMLATIAISLAFAQSLNGKLSFYPRFAENERVSLLLTPIMIASGLTLLLLFPAVTLWRLIYHRAAVRSTLGYQARRMVPFWVLWLATVVCTVIAGLWILFLSLYIIQAIRGGA